MRRVNVIGGSGSGKTTVGRALATRLGVPFVELDELHWTHPNWDLPELGEFRARVETATLGDRWVVDGSYGKARDLVWSRADTVVWLDLPFGLMLWRTVRRTVARIRSGERLWGIQKETFRGSFLSWDSVLVYALRTRPRRLRLYREWFARPEYAHLDVVRLRSQAEIERWLAGI
jgi:adenylate kinase family enzyme